MRGLLDTFFGNADQTRALGLLGAGMMNGGFAKGAPMAMEYMAGADERKLKRGLLEAQMEETRAQAEERRQKLEMARRAEERQNALLFGSHGGASGNSSSAHLLSQGGGSVLDAPSTNISGAMSGGVLRPPAGGLPGGGAIYETPSQGQQVHGSGLIGMARSMGIPEQAIQADIAFNGGKGIAEMLYKRGVPDMQVSNGYAYDRNRMGPGYLPQLNTSQDGKTSMVQIGQDGLPVVSAPRGAMSTFAGYQNIQEGVRADHDPVTVTPADQPPQITTRGALVRRPEVQGTRVPPGQQAAMDRDRQAILQQELTKAQNLYQTSLKMGDQSAAARAQGDIAAIQREMGGRSATVGMPLQSEEDKLRSTKGVEGDAKTNEARVKDIQTAKRFLAIANQAEQVLNSGPTQSGFGRMVDQGAAFIGQSTKGAEAAQQLKALGGWLVANVPRMEGPQSNFDVANYQVQAADVANDSLPVPRRMAALKAIQRMMQNQVDGGPTGDFAPPGKSPAVSAGGWSATRKN